MGGLRTLLRATYILGIVGALGFGAVAAVRAARSADCPFPPDPPMMGTCTSQMECQDLCDLEYGKGNATGVCREDQCCICIV